MLPFESFSVQQLLARDRFGSNIGNLIYQYSVVRTLMTNEVDFVSDNYSINFKDADMINATYNAYILPFADAFRSDFIPQLRRYTQLIERLTIPVIVVGIGLKASLDFNVTEGFSFDDDVRKFVDVVLKKSTMIGIRGGITGEYLQSLGYVSEKDFTIIGCPSMYTFGDKIRIQPVNLRKSTKISLNAGRIIQENSMDFLNSLSQQYPNHYFVPQEYEEFLINYFGFGQIKNVVDEFPKDISSHFYRDDRVKFFLNAPTWFNYMKSIELSIGARLHGNIVATINGVPSITIVHDARTKELVDYHCLPAVSVKDICKTTSLEQLVDEADFKAVSRKQPDRFKHYLAFLEVNGLHHIYDSSNSVDFVKLDSLIAKKKFSKPSRSITATSTKEYEQRMTTDFNIYINRVKRLMSSRR